MRSGVSDSLEIRYSIRASLIGQGSRCRSLHNDSLMPRINTCSVVRQLNMFIAVRMLRLDRWSIFICPPLPSKTRSRDALRSLGKTDCGSLSETGPLLRVLPARRRNNVVAQKIEKMSQMNKNTKAGFQIIDSQTRGKDMEGKKVDLPAVDNTESRKQLIARIEQVTLSVIQQICSGRLPQISNSLSENYTPADTQQDDDFVSEFHEEPDRNFDETERNETRTTVANFGTKRGKDRFALMMIVMSTVHRLLITNSTVTRRSLYYDLKNDRTSNLVAEQRYLDQAVHHVANLLNCSPWELNLLPTSKGLVAGELTLTLSDNRVIDCTVPGGALIPHVVPNLISVRTTAKMVLIVEKDAVFQKLLEDDCTSSLSCILITGKGYPDVATRMLVKLLSEKLQLPVYMIVDADPFGVDIMCVYRFGSAALSRERKSLACSNVRWLGIHPSELPALGVNTVPLAEFDLSKLMALEARPYMTGAFLRELGIMRTGKAEIENVYSSSGRFLAATYLPCKIKGNDYI